MKISDVISDLNELKEKHGDLELKIKIKNSEELEVALDGDGWVWDELAFNGAGWVWGYVGDIKQTFIFQIGKEKGYLFDSKDDFREFLEEDGFEEDEIDELMKQEPKPVLVLETGYDEEC